MTTTYTVQRGGQRIVRYILAAAALIFGAATIKAGGDVLFVSEQARIAAGNYVPFVLWANFIGGFLYITAGLLLLLNATQALRISVLIAAYTIAVMIALVVHIALGRAYEIRTLAAMGFRTIFWVTISVILLRTKKK